MVDIEKIEKNCLNRISTLMIYEPDPNIKEQIEEAGRTICKCMAQQATKKYVIHNVMKAATRSLPVFARAHPERKKLRPE